MSSLVQTSAELYVGSIGLCHHCSYAEALKDARHYAKLGHIAVVQPFHGDRTLTTLTYTPDGRGRGSYRIVRGIPYHTPEHLILTEH